MCLYKVVNYQYMDRILVNISLDKNNTSAVELLPVLARSCSILLSNHRRFDPSVSQPQMVCQDSFLKTFARCKLGSKQAPFACRLRLSQHGRRHFASNLPCLAEYNLYRTTSVLSFLCPYRSQTNCWRPRCCASEREGSLPNELNKLNYKFSFSINFTNFVLPFPEKALAVSHFVNACSPSNARPACPISSTSNRIANDSLTVPIEMIHTLFCIPVRMKRRPLICSATPSKIRNMSVSRMWITMFPVFSSPMILAY